MFILVLVLSLPLVLAAAPPDRLADLVERMQQFTLAGDHAAVGRLTPEVMEELTKPHPRAALAWNQVGIYFQVQGDFAEAERAYQRGVSLAEKDGNSAGDLAIVLLNLTTLYLATGQGPAHAEVLSRRALKYAIALHGPAAPELANFIYILGVARAEQGDRQGGRRFFEQALELAGDSSEGKLHQGFVRANLASLSALDKQWMPAKENFLQSIALIETALGSSHPDLIRTHLNLAVVYVQLKQWTLAAASVAKAREITEARLGGSHPLMAGILITSASILRKTGHGREARDLDRRAKAITAAQPKNPAASAWIHAADLVRSGRR